jgi:hypothetical protein
LHGPPDVLGCCVAKIQITHQVVCM